MVIVGCGGAEGGGIRIDDCGSGGDRRK